MSLHVAQSPHSILLIMENLTQQFALVLIKRRKGVEGRRAAVSPISSPASLFQLR